MLSHPKISFEGITILSPLNCSKWIWMNFVNKFSWKLNGGPENFLRKFLHNSNNINLPPREKHFEFFQIISIKCPFPIDICSWNILWFSLGFIQMYFYFFRLLVWNTEDPYYIHPVNEIHNNGGVGLVGKLVTISQ